MAHTETMLESREIFNGRVIRVTVDKVQLEDGTTSTREIVHHHGGACILPVDADGSVTMVRQFRYAFGEEIWELPAGKLEADEDPFEAAKRELSEECGLTADNFIDLGVVYATVGYDSEKIYLWAATGLHSTAQHLDAGEFLDVVKMPFDEALGLVMDGTIKDSKTQVALLKYAQLRAKVRMGVEILDNGTRVLTAPGATFGTDALLLARFAQPRRNERALDLCSGCGIVSLVWHDAGHRGPCTALEIDPAASALCAAALAENTDAAHIAPVCGDLRQFCTAGPEQGQYDFAACNPPYFTAGPRSPDPRRAEARHTGSCTTADAVDCARRALRDGGRFLLCQRPEQLAEILAALRAARLEPKRLAFVKNRPDAAPWLFLVEAQKGRKTGLRVEPDILIQSGAALYGPTTL